MRKPTDSTTRKLLLERLNRHLREDPTTPVSFSDLGREFGMSRQRIHALYNELKTRNRLPPVQDRGAVLSRVFREKHREEREERQLRWKELDDLVLRLRLEGVTFKEIVSRIGVPLSAVRRSRDRLVIKGLTQSHLRSERHRAKVEEVKRLRLTGLTYPEIAKNLGIHVVTVTRIMRELVLKGVLPGRAGKARKGK